MDRLGLADPASVAYAGDTPVDVACGVSAGCAAVYALACGAHTVQELHDAVRGTPARVAEDLAHAVDDLDRRGLLPRPAVSADP